MLPASIPSPASGVLHVGPLPLRAYAAAILTGVLVAVVIGQRRASARGLPAGSVADMAVWAIPAGIVGARLYHVLTSPGDYFGAGGEPVRALEVWKGGLGIWGGVAGGALAAWLWCRRRGVDFPRLADACAPGMALAQAVGRLGNYANQELFGGPSSLPWAVEIEPGRPGTVPGATTYHPTFLYEMLWDATVAGLCVLAERLFRLRRGQTFALYVALYCVGRAPIEALRVDPATLVLGLRVNIWVCLVVCALATLVFLALGRREPTASGEAEEHDGATEQSGTSAEEVRA